MGGSSWQAVGLFGQNCAILPQTILPDRIRSTLFAPWRTVYRAAIQRDLTPKTRWRNLGVNQPHMYIGFLFFCPAEFQKRVKNAISYLLTGICESLLGTSLGSFLMFTGVSAHMKLRGRIPRGGEMWNFWGGKYLIWWSLWFVSSWCLDWYLWLYFTSQQALASPFARRTWNFIQQPVDRQDFGHI